MLTPGQLGSVNCDMQAPEDDDSLLIEAEVDRGTSIDEVNETNNMKTTVVAIVDPLAEDTSSAEDAGYEFSQMTVYIITGGVLLLILTVFGMLAPAKIRKLE